jgi:murein tripeptide amidase MpaA
MAYNLLTKYASSSEIKGFVDKYDFYVFPVVNPDGEQFSRGRRNVILPNFVW